MIILKIAHFIPCNSTVNSRHLAKLLLDNVHRLYKSSSFVIGDRDTRYTSHFIKILVLVLATTLCLSTAYHLQSDGNTERSHRTFCFFLPAFVHADHFHWFV